MVRFFKTDWFNLTAVGLRMVFGILFLAPFAWIISTSLKPTAETMSLPPRWISSTIQWRNYPDAIKAIGHFWLYARHSLYLCVMTVIGTVASSTLAAYGFSRIEWRGRDNVFMVLLATMMIPFPMIMVPIFGLLKSLGWVGSFKPLWVPSFFRRGIQRVFAAAIFPDPARGSGRGGADRRLQRVPDFLKDHPAAVQTGAGGDAVPIHGHLERLPRAAHLSDGTKGLLPSRWDCRVSRASRAALRGTFRWPLRRWLSCRC